MMVYDISDGPYAGDRASFERNACKEGKSAKDLAEDDLAKFKVTMNQRGHQRHLLARRRCSTTTSRATSAWT